MANATRRSSKYTTLIQQQLAFVGHATNAELAAILRQSYSSVSDTTVHRITQRLLADGEVQLAPPRSWGAMVYDANTSAHDHFECEICGRLQDMIVSSATRRDIRETVGRCDLHGPLKIVGTCCGCISK